MNLSLRGRLQARALGTESCRMQRPMRWTSERKRDLAPKLRVERLETRITLSAAPMGPEFWLAMAPHFAATAAAPPSGAATAPAAISTPTLPSPAESSTPISYAPITPIVFARSFDWLAGVAPRSDSQSIAAFETTAPPTPSITFTPPRSPITVDAGNISSGMIETQTPGDWNVERIYTKLESTGVGTLAAPLRTGSISALDRGSFSLVNSASFSAQNVAFNVAKFDFVREFSAAAQPISTFLVGHVGDFKLGEWPGTAAGRPVTVGSGRVEILESSVLPGGSGSVSIASSLCCSGVETNCSTPSGPRM